MQLRKRAEPAITAGSVHRRSFADRTKRTASRSAATAPSATAQENAPEDWPRDWPESGPATGPETSPETGPATGRRLDGPVATHELGLEQADLAHHLAVE